MQGSSAIQSNLNQRVGPGVKSQLSSHAGNQIEDYQTCNKMQAEHLQLHTNEPRG